MNETLPERRQRDIIGRRRRKKFEPFRRLFAGKRSIETRQKNQRKLSSPPPPPPTPPLRCTGRLKRAGCFKLSTRWRDGRRSRPVSAEPSELGVPQTYLADRIRSSRPPHPQSDPLRSVRMRRKPREDTAGHVLVRQGIRNSYRAHSKKWSFETTRSQKKKPSQQQKMDASS